MIFKNNNRIDTSESNKLCFWCLVGIVVLSAAFYGYCVRGTIVNIVSRQNMENNLAVLSSKVSNLEAEYLRVKNSITPELAESMGFVVALNQKFVNLDTKTPGLSLAVPSI